MTKDLEENYSKAKYHSPQKYGEKLAVVFVDFANAYFDQESPLFGGEGCQIALDNSVKRSLSSINRGTYTLFIASFILKGTAVLFIS